MSSNHQGTSTPSLSSILQTLAAYAPPATESTSQSLHQLDPGNNDDEEYIPPPPGQQLQLSNHYAKPHQQNPPIAQHRAPPQASFSQPSSHSRFQTDPATITTYPAALRCVSTMVNTNPAIHQRISHLIREQHAHERQWWKGREDLCKKISGRKERQKEADEVLRRLRSGREILGLPDVLEASDGAKELGRGVSVEEGEVEDDEEKKKEELRKELEVYDGKVWMAQTEMCDAMEKELKGVEIPGFCIKESLVRREGSRGLKALKGEDGDGSGTGAQKSLTVGELVEFKRKLVSLLGDLCGEEEA